MSPLFMPVPSVDGRPSWTSGVLYLRKLPSHTTRINVRKAAHRLQAAALPLRGHRCDRGLWPFALTIHRKGGNLLAKYENLILVSERRRPVRVAPLPADQWDDAVDQALAVMLPEERRTPDKASNILSTFVHHPALLKEFLKFNVHLLFRSTLPPRERELAILRVAHRTGSEYEWVQHVRMGKNEGLTEQDVAGVQRGEAADDFDRTILAGVDELMDSYEMS